ncbi:hypothetical protein AB6A40_007458 [Gnathostoma spinigerum]|uniref:Uncharacterized protein n=1 Tax=Gnathostoma spinigerum TaxID=75299 RepID=A0ABD6ETX9_9BILA
MLSYILILKLENVRFAKYDDRFQPNITNTETHCGEASGSRRSMAMSTTSSGTSSMARPTSLNLKTTCSGKLTSLVSPIVESSRLHGIDEEHHYSGRCLDNMSKSSTIPETMHSSTQSQFPLLMARQSCGMSNRFEDSLKNYEKGFDKNGNADCDSPLLGNTGISSLLASSRLMSSSLASDSGCMVDSGSSLATTDEERKNFSVEDITVMNSNESIEKLDSNLVRKGSALEMNIARV